MPLGHKVELGGINTTDHGHTNRHRQDHNDEDKKRGGIHFVFLLVASSKAKPRPGNRGF
jgi:hypothetical protein